MKFLYGCLLILVFFSLLVSFSAQAQQKPNGSLKGKLKEAKTGEPVMFASFVVKRMSDSTVVSSGLTGKDGAFEVKHLPLGSYRFYVAFIGLKPVTKLFDITLKTQHIDFDEINMVAGAIQLNEISVKGDVVPMLIKKDTIQFNANAYKTLANANLQDLLRKLPGIQVDDKGKMTTQGKTIARLTVDGKPFFGKDPNVALQNLPKDIVDKVEVIDSQTEDAKFKHIDDGVKEKVINIKLKEGKNHGYFGAASLAGGNDEHYDAGLNLNNFNKSRQLGIMLSANDINRYGMFRGDNEPSFDFGEAMGGMGSGLNKIRAGMFSYRNVWSDKLELNFNYTLNDSKSNGNSFTKTLNLLQEKSYFNEQNNITGGKRTGHNFNFSLSWTVDSNTSIRFEPNFTLNKAITSSNSNFRSYTQNTGSAINTGSTNNSNDSSIPAFDGSLIVARKLGTKGRNIALQLNGNYGHNDATGFNRSLLMLYNNPGSPTPIDTTKLDQFLNMLNRERSTGLNLSYSEPLTKKMKLNFVYNLSNSKDHIDRNVYDYNDFTGAYDKWVNKLSKQYDNKRSEHNLTTNLHYDSEKTDLYIGLSYRNIMLGGEDLVTGAKYNAGFNNVSPSARLSFKLNSTTRIGLNYDNRFSTPDITSLQPIIDNSDPLYVIKGNPELKPETGNSFSIDFNTYSVKSNRNMGVRLGFNTNSNSIINNTIIDPATGKQTATYENVNGNHNFDLNAYGSLKFKDLNLTISPSFGGNYARNASFINNRLQYSLNTTYYVACGIQYSYLDKLEVYAQPSMNISTVHYDTQGQPNNKFQTFRNSLTMTLNLPYEFKFMLNSVVNYNQSLNQAAANILVSVYNVGFEKQFLNNTLSARISVNDVTNNNSRSYIYSNGLTVVEGNAIALRRYFMLGLSYKMKKFGSM